MSATTENRRVEYMIHKMTITERTQMARQKVNDMCERLNLNFSSPHTLFIAATQTSLH